MSSTPHLSDPKANQYASSLIRKPPPTKPVVILSRPRKTAKDLNPNTIRQANIRHLPSACAIRSFQFPFSNFPFLTSNLRTLQHHNRIPARSSAPLPPKSPRGAESSPSQYLHSRNPASPPPPTIPRAQRRRSRDPKAAASPEAACAASLLRQILRSLQSRIRQNKRQRPRRIYFTVTSFCRTIGCNDRASCSRNLSTGDSPCCRKISAPRSICKIASASGVPCDSANAPPRSASNSDAELLRLQQSHALVRHAHAPHQRPQPRRWLTLINIWSPIACKKYASFGFAT